MRHRDPVRLHRIRAPKKEDLLEMLAILMQRNGLREVTFDAKEFQRAQPLHFAFDPFRARAAFDLSSLEDKE